MSGAGGISLLIKGRRVTPRLVEAIRVPVRWMNFNSRRRIEFVKSSTGREKGRERARMEEGEYNGIRETSGDE